MDKNTAIREAKKYAKRVRQEFSPASIVMFGSYVNGTPHEWSDIDVAVIFDGFKGNWHETASHLCGLTYDIDDMIEPHILDKSNDPSGFVKEVIRTGMEIA